MTPPTVIEDQVGCHALDAPPSANLDGNLICGANDCKQKQQYSVFLELRMAAKSDLAKIRQGRNLAQDHVFVGQVERNLSFPREGRMVYLHRESPHVAPKRAYLRLAVGEFLDNLSMHGTSSRARHALQNSLDHRLHA